MKEKLENFLINYRQALEQAADALAQEEIPKLTVELFDTFFLTGNRLQYEKVYFQRRKRLTVYGTLAILNEGREYVEKLEETLLAVCEEECWALPAHVNKEQKNWQLTIDLFAAETACYLAELVGRLETVISEGTRERVREEVFRRVLTPFSQSEVPYAWWEHCTMNWCAVCNGAIGSAAIWMMKDSELLQSLLERVCHGLEYYIAGFGEDGACLEGLGYYTYGLSFYVAFAALLKEHTKGEWNLFVTPKLKQIALFQQKCHLPGGRTVSFADSSNSDEFRMGLTCCLKMHYPEVEFPELSVVAGFESDDCYRYLMVSRDFLFTKQYLEMPAYDVTACGAENMESKTGISGNMGVRQVLLPQAQWSLTIGENGSVLAVKGGHNDEPHNHNDVGSFFYQVDGEQVLTDLGVGEYTREYFNEMRYQQLCCRSLGHNLPLIDNMEQLAGAEYCATTFAGDEKGSTSITFGRAYPLEEKEEITRHIWLDAENGIMQMEDVFLLKDTRTVTENLVTQYIPRVCADGFIIKTRKRMYHVICGFGEDFRVVPEIFRNHQGEEEKVWLMQWEVVGKIATVKVEAL